MDAEAPVALFLEDGSDRCRVASLAAQAGFRSLLAPWQCCHGAQSRVVVRDASEADARGELRAVPGVLATKPDFVAVLSRLPAALHHGRELATTVGAIWGNAEYAQEDHRADAGPVTYGVAETRGGGAHLRLICLVDQPGDPLALVDVEVAKAKLAVNCRAVVLIGLVVDAGAARLARVPLYAPSGDAATARLEAAILVWLQHARRRAAATTPMRLPDRRALQNQHDDDLALTASHLPRLFETPQAIETELVAGASFAYLHPELVPLDGSPDEDTATALRRMLCRRRARPAAGDGMARTEPRLVETGVGRACLVDGLSLKLQPHIADFTVLGVGLTGYSEGGFIEMGRPIDGKTAMVRAWHRKRCAERLEPAGCRTGTVVAIVELPDEKIELVDGSQAPASLVVRGFRCVLRVKQLDPIVCALHSVQHTPLVSAYLTRRVHDLRAALNLPEARGLRHDELLARQIEAQGASQASLRELLDSAATSTDGGVVDDWRMLVRRVRLEAIDEYAPLLLDLARRRLAQELNVARSRVDDASYLEWFARCLGEQLAIWRHMRFLHDYHHAGVSRWRPHSLFSLGENNVGLLAEFPDLDTALFVDDPVEELVAILQLRERDVSLLREQFPIFHQREVLAAATVVRTLAMVASRHDTDRVDHSVETFWRAYADG